MLISNVYGTTSRSGAAKQKRASGATDWAHKKAVRTFQGPLKRDSTRTKKTGWAPELVQAAEFLGISPRNLWNQLQSRPASAVKLAELQAKFNW